MRQKIRSYIGFAIKSGNIIFGADTVIVNRKKAHLILMTDTINRTASKKVTSYAERFSISLITVTDNLMEECVDKINCKCIAILDKNLANAVKNSLIDGGATNE